MFRPSPTRAGLALLAVVAAAALWLPAGPVRLFAAWIALMVLPGLALYLAVERRPVRLEALLAALVLSPVLTASVVTLAMLAGASPTVAARALAVAAGLAGSGWMLGAHRPMPVLTARRALVLAGFIVLLCVVTGYLPMTREWWRVRSDAWAHAAWVAQIADFGLPPQDPYFVGMPLQYMWLYHVLVLALSRGTGLDPFHVMAAVNLQALAALVVGSFAFASVLRERFADRMMSAVTVVLGLNAAFWVFLPVKLLRAFTGQVRGWAEVSRLLSLSPLSYRTVTQVLSIYHNKTFFLDKFMVATAYGLALALMTAVWWGAASYLRTRRPVAAVTVAVALAGALGFHTLVGIVMLVGVCGATAVMFLTRGRIEGFRPRPTLVLAAAAVAGLVVMSPYLYTITHAKSASLSVSVVSMVQRIIGLTIAVALGVVLALRQRAFLASREVVARFVVLAGAFVVVTATLIPLPDSNAFDKPPFLVFFPLAIVGGWTLVDLVARRRTRSRRLAAAVAVAVLCFLPVNVLSLVGCYADPTHASVTAGETQATAWIRTHTGRRAVLIDDDPRVVFLVTVPRRYYWGRLAYARQWMYDPLEMARRYHAWKGLYGTAPLDAVTLAALGSVREDFYAVVRPAEHPPNVAVATHPEYFRKVYDAGGVAIYHIDTARCRQDAASGDLPRVGREELLREYASK